MEDDYKIGQFDFNQAVVLRLEKTNQVQKLSSECACCPAMALVCSEYGSFLIQVQY